MLRVSNISNGKNDIVVNGEIAHQEFYLGVGDWFMVGKTPYIAVNQEMQSARGDVMEILGIRSHTAIDALLIAAVRDSGRHMLLIGESGSDQERLARMVHQISHRRHKRFYDLGPKAVLDADTRANLRDTEGGTVLVDVLKRGALDQKLAAALMHPDLALRLVIATYSPEKALASFSAPLVHGATHIRIPPVCERREEIAELLDKWFIGSRSALRFPLLRPELKTGLLSYDWPENLKELRTTAHNLMQVAHYRSEREAAKNSELSREQLRGWFRRLGITIKYPLIAE
jgi:DNA-binding NtrC family response regulator